MENQAIEVQKEEQRGGLKETIRQIFEAVVPADQFEQIVGPSEFSVMQQSFNQLVEEAVNEDSAALYALVGQQIEEKDAKIEELTVLNVNLEMANNRLEAEAQESRKESEDAKNRARAAEVQVDDLSVGLKFANEQTEEKQREIDNLQSIIASKDAEIARLREERVAQTHNIDATPYKPSATLQDKITDSQNRIKSALELALEGRPFRGKVTADGTFPEPPALQYDPEAIAENDRIPTPEAPSAVTEDTFQGDVLAGLGTAGEGETESFEAEVRRRIEQLEVRVFGNSTAIVPPLPGEAA